MKMEDFGNNCFGFFFNKLSCTLMPCSMKGTFGIINEKILFGENIM